MNKEEIMQIIPHRNSMLLIDEATKTGEKTCTGKKTIVGDEWFLDGHFPGHPVVPGVILCEIMAQASAVIVSGVSQDCLPFFTGIEKAKFRRQVQPGDTLEIECELIDIKRNFYFVKGKGSVNGKLCVSAEFSFALVEKTQG